MARPAQVFVRRLRAKERAWLRSLRRRNGGFASPVTVGRAQVIVMSRRRYPAPEIADALDATCDWVRGVIHEFNDIGLEALGPAWSGGRPREITDEMRARIVEIVDSHPQELGEPYTTWSLSHLRTYLMGTGVVRTISKERLRVILIEEGHTTQTTKGWKYSPDPDFSTKAARLRRLYRAAESGSLAGVLVCFDEHGPVTPIPKAGRGWWPKRRLGRIRANYRKPHGVAQFFGVYDVGADQLFGRWFSPQGGGPRDHHLEDDPGPLPGEAHLGRPGQPVLALDHRGARRRPPARGHARGHPHLRLVDEPHRVPLRGHGESRLRGVGLPGPPRDPGGRGRLPAAEKRRSPAPPGGAPGGPAGPSKETAGRSAPSGRRLSKPIASAQ